MAAQLTRGAPASGVAISLGTRRTLDSLTVSRVRSPQRDTHEVVVEVTAAAVNRSDVLNALGVFPNVAVGRIPGRDFSGTIVDGPAATIGQEVWGTGGGDLGLTRDGSHARYLTLPAAAVVTRPDRLGPVEAGAAGLAYLTAATALREVGPLAAGASVLVAGAGGAVGGAVAGLASARGFTVIGLVRGSDNAAEALAQGVDLVIDADQDEIAAEVMRVTSGRGVDAAIDAVGPPMVGAILPLLAAGGCLCLFTSPQGGDLRFEVLDFYRRALRIVGVNTLRQDSVAAGSALAQLVGHIERGDLRPPRVARTLPIEQAREAYSAVHAGDTGGRIVLLPGGGPS